MDAFKIWAAVSAKLLVGVASVATLVDVLARHLIIIWHW